MSCAQFLHRAFYEIADEHEPWCSYTRSAPAATGDPVRAARTPSPADVAWSIFPRARAVLLPQIVRVIGDTMASRERTKSLAMRTLHAFRLLVPRLAALQGVGSEDWPYLTLDELTDPRPAFEFAQLAEQRRAECHQALAEDAPELLDTSGAPPAAVERRDGRGVSPGVVSGVVVHAADALSAAVGASDEPRILVCDSADADVQPLLPHVAGVLTARGSLLSHVSILVRERRIPAVVGHSLALAVRPGQHISIDGTTGEVILIDDN
jgi:pyruvate,water dikinase